LKAGSQSEVSESLSMSSRASASGPTSVFVSGANLLTVRRAQAVVGVAALIGAAPTVLVARVAVVLLASALAAALTSAVLSTHDFLLCCAMDSSACIVWSCNPTQLPDLSFFGGWLSG
jgi:hypothetical protein